MTKHEDTPEEAAIKQQHKMCSNCWHFYGLHFGASCARIDCKCKNYTQYELSEVN